MRIRNPYVQLCPKGSRHRRTRRTLRDRAQAADWSDELEDLWSEESPLAPEASAGGVSD